MISSEEILKLYRRNEKEAVRLLFETYRDTLYLFCFRIVGDRKAAEDILQDIFVDLWVNRRIEKTRGGGILNYLYGAVRNASLNYLRGRERAAKLYGRLEPDKSVMPEELPIETTNEFKRIHEAVDRLPEQRRKIFLMIAIEGLKYHETADRLGISVNTVKTQMKRALKSLRETFDTE